MERMKAQIESIIDLLPHDILPHPSDFWAMMSKKLLEEHPFALCALDVAYWDLWGKTHNKPLYDIWDLDISNNPITDYTIGMDTVEKMIAKMQETPFPLYKIKLGTNDDLDIVEALRQETDAIFRVDANTAWTPEQTIYFAPELQKLGVEFIEQPLKADNWDGMKRVYKESTLPIIADESCILESDVEKCAGYFHGINIKLTKCSGITPALRMIEAAHTNGLKVMLGSMNESTIGSAAIGQMAALVDCIDMDGPLLLAEDNASGLTYEQGRVVLQMEQPGLGIAVHPDLFPQD
jgi:L-alanine-DL-glutamate epimerase-like enolase superfamily enzyme